ncbi:MAG TPA: biotin carboxylase N-terminal domain-containing protein [Coleofasciculaceae cyanobacterium]|jgi:acetyl-CoA carboxylase biotin carboxylase subunit
MFNKVLVANRGEIAVRIMQTLQEMGIRTVALASDPDLQAEHVRRADEVIHLAGQKPAETYLQGDLIVTLAKERGVDAIHPGYGFLSENAGFAQACADAGIVFIGPKPDVIRDMGDKITAKALMKEAGVPVVPGWSGDVITSPGWSGDVKTSPGWSGDPQADFKVIANEAGAIGYPILVKAAAGGGGKGMRLVQKPEDLQAALEAAAREAKSAFGDARVFLEKYITRPRHIEFQVFGDHHGNVVHMFERECSIQRRHQKVIEETPSPALTPALRASMGEAAVKAAKAMRYTNAGTIEFILGEDGGFYFLEVNTRLQVEHPVTEMTIHKDLVRLQLMVATGEPLPFTQKDLCQDGHAIECRIYAEDPANNFMPGIGKLAFYRPPSGPGIRLDNGVREGGEVTVHYDPMLAKLIAWGENRQAAIAKISWALSRYAVLGVANNVEFLKAIVDHPAFADGNVHTHFLEEHPIRLNREVSVEALLIAGLSSQILKGRRVGADNGVQEHKGIPSSPWTLGGAWRQLACQK